MAHILIIDDDPDFRFILETFLRGEGHTTDSAKDGKAGIRLAGLNSYDLLITDIVMPEMDGLEVITVIKRKLPGLRIIAMSGGTTKLDKELLLTTANLMRADTVVDKPLNLQKLRTAVNDILANGTQS